MSRAQVEAKARDLLTTVLDAATAARLITAIDGVEQVADDGELVAMMCVRR